MNMKKLFIFLSIAIFFTVLPAFSQPGSSTSQSGHAGSNTGISNYYKKTSKPALPTRTYNRKDWPHWTDDDHDCQNTRAEILIRDNIGLLKYKRNKPCNVTWGKWICPYTGKEFTKTSDLDIDHIVPLAYAHKTGGANWPRAKKKEFANDQINLVAVEDNINQEKGDQGPDEWRPPLKSYWQEYARRWRKVKQKYGLYIGPVEEAALKDMERQ